MLPHATYMLFKFKASVFIFYLPAEREKVPRSVVHQHNEWRDGRREERSRKFWGGEIPSFITLRNILTLKEDFWHF